MDDERGRSVKAVQLSCDILEALRELDQAGVTELAEHLGVSKGAVHNHLTTLHSNELVIKDGDSYRISLRFLDFGVYAKRQIDVYESARRATEQLAEKSGEVAHFMAEELGKGVYIHKERGENAVRTKSYVGDRKFLHCTSQGKAILAHLPQERTEEIVETHGLPRRTENTITDRDELFSELEEIRRRGYAFDDEEILSGLRCVGAPVWNQEETLEGAVSVAGPTSRLKGDRFSEDLPEMVLDAANVIKINSSQVG